MTIGLGIALTAPPAQAQDISSGLIGHWKLDETTGATIADSAGSNTGTWTDGSGNSVAQETTIGKFGTALTFDGANDRISIPHNADFNVASYSIAAWVNFADSDSVAFIFSKDNGASYPEYALFYDTDDDGFYCGIPFDSVFEGFVPTGGTWYHIACTYDASTNTGIIYIDGVAGTPAVLTADPGSSTSYQEIGGSPGSGYYTDGILDDVRVYSRVLTAADVGAIIEGTQPGALRYNEKSEAIEYHNGTQWVHTGLGSYSPNAVSMSGGANHVSYGTAFGPDNVTSWSGSFWIKRAAVSNALEVFFDMSNAAFPNVERRVDIDILANNKLSFIAVNSSDTVVLEITSDAITDTNWHHVMYSFNIKDAAKRHIYIDGVSAIDTVTTYDNTSHMSFSAIETTIGNSIGGGTDFDYEGDIADFWLDFGTYVDLSDAANRAKFISSNGMPMYLGPDGSLPFGFAPDVFLSGNTDDWHLNKGTGGDFTENGALTDATTQPGGTSSDMTWAQDGATLSTGFGNPALSKLNSNTIAFIDTDNEALTTLEWSAGTWGIVGNALDLTGIGNPALATIGSNTVALADDANDELTTYEWDGTDWSQVGNSYTLTGISGDIAITALGTNTVAFIGQSVFELTTLAWDGTNWAQVGNELFITNAFNPALATIDTNTIAFYATSSVSALRTYKWDGSNWSQIGNDLSGSMNKVGIAALTTNKIALWGETHEELRTYEWNGTDWSQVGAGTSVTIPFSGYIRLTALDPNTIALVNDPSDDLETFRFEDQTPCSTPTTQPGSIIYNADDLVMQYCNGTEYVAMGPIGGTGGGGCANPTGAAGDIIFNENYTVIQYCNSEDWVAVGKRL